MLRISDGDVVGMSKMLLIFLQVAHIGGLVSATLSFPTDFFSRRQIPKLLVRKMSDCSGGAFL